MENYGNTSLECNSKFIFTATSIVHVTDYGTKLSHVIQVNPSEDLQKESTSLAKHHFKYSMLHIQGITKVSIHY
jgi:hypothetical protein